MRFPGTPCSLRNVSVFFAPDAPPGQTITTSSFDARILLTTDCSFARCASDFGG